MVEFLALAISKYHILTILKLFEFFIHSFFPSICYYCSHSSSLTMICLFVVKSFIYKALVLMLIWKNCDEAWLWQPPPPTWWRQTMHRLVYSLWGDAFSHASPRFKACVCVTCKPPTGINFPLISFRYLLNLFLTNSRHYGVYKGLFNCRVFF